MDTSLLVWTPRILAVGLTAFIAAFALDSADDGAWAVLVHVVPALILTVVTALAWRWALVGGAAFTLGAVLYALMVPDRPAWILTISGPMLLIGFLFFRSSSRRP
jgi:hypothetical protein